MLLDHTLGEHEVPFWGKAKNQTENGNRATLIFNKRPTFIHPLPPPQRPLRPFKLCWLTCS